MKIFDNFDLKSALETREWYFLKGHPFYDYIDTFGIKEEDFSKYYKIINPVAPETREIKDIPFGMTDDGGVACIPYDLNDIPNIGCYGNRRRGKTSLIHSLIDRLFNYQKRKIIILNDYLSETPIWSTKCSTSNYMKKINLLYEKPCALPIVCLIPNAKFKRIKPIRKSVPQLNFSIDFKDFIDNINLFVPDLGGSEKYFKNLDFSSCYSKDATYQSLMDVLNQLSEPNKNSPNKKEARAMIDVREKILNAIQMYLNEGILSLSPDRLTLLSDGEETENPFIMVLKHKGIPSLISGDISKKNYFPKLLRYIVDDIRNYHQSSPSFMNNGLYFFIEELSEIMGLQDSESAMQVIKEISLQGGQVNIGLIINTQNYHKVPDDIASNADYAFMFQTSSKEDIVKFCKDYQINKKEYGNKIGSYPRHNFMAVTKTGNLFRIYYPANNKIIESEGPIECITIPPLSNQLPPSEMNRWNTQKDTDDSGETKNFYVSLIKNNIKLINPATGEIINNRYKRRNEAIYIPKYSIPIIVQHLDPSSYYYPRKPLRKIEPYSFLINKGIYIYHNIKRNYYFIRNGYSPTKEAVPLAEIPKDKYILNYVDNKRVKLIGNRCENKLIKYE